VDYERLECRAYGLLLKDLTDRVDSGDAEAVSSLRRLRDLCLHNEVILRPTFAEVVATLSSSNITP